MPSKTIRVTCDTKLQIPLDELHAMQGGLKTASVESYKKFRAQILKNGINFSLHVWKELSPVLKVTNVNQKKKTVTVTGTKESTVTWWIVDGHLRKLLLSKMRDEEGYSIPPLPCVEIHAASFKDAKRQVLAASSAFHKITTDGLYGFMSEAEIEFDEFKDAFELPEIDVSSFGAEFFEDPLVTKGLTDDDEIPEQVPARTKRGDLYKLGEHRLLCGDSTSREDVERLMNGEKADMVFTDPPYGISIVSSASTIGGAKAMTGSIGQDGVNKILRPRVYKKIEGDENPDVAFLAIKLFPECDWIIWGGNFLAHNLPLSTHWLVWNKHAVDGAGDGSHFSDAELAWTNFDRTSVKMYRFGWSGLFRNGVRKEELKARVHPTQKPVGLFSEILSDYSKDSSLILDPFLGSGSTLIACEKTGRRCYGMEIDPHYCDVIVERWEKYTGKKAELLNPKPNKKPKRPTRKSKSQFK